ncbi:hypothetical protein OG21DRAFT_1547422 [Imleria badia]|nr:hypothetical protein OG21DRAFT_1547422 [Imleria badia]
MTFCRHVHEDEEIRYILEGGGFFDVHGAVFTTAGFGTRFLPGCMDTNKWIRFVVNPGDLALLPAGIYHRFMLDERNMIKERSPSNITPRWVPHYRGEVTDNNPYRVEYLCCQLLSSQIPLVMYTNTHMNATRTHVRASALAIHTNNISDRSYLRGRFAKTLNRFHRQMFEVICSIRRLSDVP